MADRSIAAGMPESGGGTDVNGMGRGGPSSQAPESGESAGIAGPTSSRRRSDERTAEELSHIAMVVATRAGELVMQGYRKHMDVKRKDERQLVTEYDLRSEELVRQLLAEQTPGVSIVGEEQGGEGGGAGLTWYVDPIDGTNNFIAGSPIFAISLGARLNDIPIAGAVVAPALGLRWSGYSGGQAERNGEVCRTSSIEHIGDAIVSTGYPSRKGPVSAEQYSQIVQRFRDVRRCGSAAVELCWVADGTYQVYWSPTLPYWDTTGAAAVVLAAGGTWHNGHRTQGPSWDFATNGPLDASFKELLEPLPAPHA